MSNTVEIVGFINRHDNKGMSEVNTILKHKLTIKNAGAMDISQDKLEPRTHTKVEDEPSVTCKKTSQVFSIQLTSLAAAIYFQLVVVSWCSVVFFSRPFIWKGS